MKVYVVKNDAAVGVLQSVINGDIKNITASISSRPYMCFDIWGNYINTIQYLKDVGCVEHEFPPKDNK